MDRHVAGPQGLSRLFEREFTALLALALPEDGDVMTSPKRPHACLSPCMALARAMSQPIEQRCNAAVRQQPSQRHEQLFDFDVGRPAMFARTVLDNAELRVVAALPVHYQLEVRVRDPDDDLLDHSPQDSLA